MTGTTLGLGILSWRAPRSLRLSLESYARADLFGIFDEVCIVFQECTPEDEALAREFGLPWRGFADNLGILGGFKRMAESLQSDYALLLEEDFTLEENASEARRQIREALADLRARRVDLYHFRHLHKHDHAIAYAVTKHRRYHLPRQDISGRSPPSLASRLLTRGRSLLLAPRAQRLRGRAVYCERNPHQAFPEAISRTPEGNYVIDSRAFDWTNPGTLIRRDFMLETIVPYVEQHPSRIKQRNGFQNIESALRCPWWRRAGFKAGIANPGLFRQQPLQRQQVRLPDGTITSRNP